MLRRATVPPPNEVYIELLDFLPAPPESEDVLLELLRTQRAGGHHTGPCSREERPLPPDAKTYFELVDFLPAPTESEDRSRGS